MKTNRASWKNPFLLAATLVALVGCGGGVADLDEVVLSPEDEGAADTASTASARLQGTTVWIEKAIPRATRPNGEVLVLRGRTSRDLVDGSAFVFDDPYGEWASRGVRSFEVTWMPTELRGLVSGVNQFLALNMKPSAGRPNRLYARLIARPRLWRFGGSGLSLTAEVLPVISTGRMHYRVKGTASSKIYGLRAWVGDSLVADVTLKDDTHFQADLEDGQLIEKIGSDTVLRFEARLLSGTVTKTARLGLYVGSLGLTASDPYEVWPARQCEARVKQCLQALPPETQDLGPCGEARAVQYCLASVGVMVDTTAISQATSDGENRIGDANGLGGDSVALVGSGRAQALVTATKSAAAQRLDEMFGLWFLSATARKVGLRAEVEAAIDLAYAYPLRFEAPLDPRPGDAQRTRDVATDGLLAYLAGKDLVHTEFDKPLVEITRQYRAWHVKDIRFFRQDARPGSWSPNPGWDNYVGNWLSPMVEIRVERATGRVVEVYFEID
jgi:hypothetical protein